MANWADRLAKLAQALATAGTVPETSISTAETDTDLSLRPDGAGSVEWGPGGGPSLSSRSSVSEDFFSGTTPFDGGVSVVAVSGGSGATTAAADRPGVQILSTGVNPAGRIVLFTLGGTGILFGGVLSRYGAMFSLSTLSDGTDTYTVRAGFGDSSAADSTDGVYFRYTDAVNGGNWEAVARSNSAETPVDTGIAADTNWHTFEITVAADGASAEFFIDDVSVATVSSDVPTGANRQTGLMPLGIIKSLGATARTVSIDAYWYIFDFDPAR